MNILEREVRARERATTASTLSRARKPSPRVPTGAALLASGSNFNSKEPMCVYCNLSHTSASCTVVTSLTERKDTLHKSGRCYICLRKNHLSRKCRSSANCRICHGRHHTTICPNQGSTQVEPLSNSSRTGTDTPGQNTVSTPTNTLYVGAQTPVADSKGKGV